MTFALAPLAAHCRCPICIAFDREQGVFQRALLDAQERKRKQKDSNAR